MGKATGSTSILGIAQNTNANPWTAAGIAATDKIPFTAESINWSPVNVDTAVLHGEYGKLGSRIVHLPVEGSIETEIWYDLKASSNFFGVDTLFGMLCGDKGVYANGCNYFLPADDFMADEPISTIGILMGDVVKEIPNFVVGGCSISGSSGSAITGSFDIVGRQMTIGDTSTGYSNIGGFDPTNTSASLKALFDAGPDYDTAHYNPATFNDVKFYLGDTANILAASTDEIGISDFGINISNNLSGSEQSSAESANHTNSFWNIQPDRNGMREVTLDFTLPRFSADTMLGYRDNQTELQCKIEMKKDASNQIDFLFPSIRIQSVDAPVSGSGLITMSCSAKAYIPTHTVTKFFGNTGVTVNREFGIETKNARTAAPWS